MKVEWTTVKPKFNKECLLMTAVRVGKNKEWEYHVWQIKKIYEGEQWYYGWLTGDGDEYGDISDLRADRYCVMPLLKNGL